MADDMVAWKNRVLGEVRMIADEEFQRKSWFGVGPWVNSLDEQFCGFFDDADVPEFLTRTNNGLSGAQTSKLSRLADLMRHLSDDMPDCIGPEDLIDDPRWVEIRKQAGMAFAALSKDG